jgi:opacity protein-like surface antigen
MIVDPGGKKTIKKYDPKTRTYKAVEPPKEDETPKQIVPTSFGLFGGFSYLRSPDETAQNLDGFTSSLFYNITPHVGVGGEFTGVSGSAQVGTTTDVSLQRQLYQFGPQFSFYANPKVSVVVYLLFGGVHDTSKTTIGTSSTSFSANAFAMAFGGGVDVNLNNHFAIRPIQFDYVRTRFGGVWQNNLRFSTGVVVHIGKRVHTE